MNNANKFVEGDELWYHQKKVQLTLKLCSCEYVHREGVDELIKIFDKFTTEVTLKHMKYNVDKRRKKKNHVGNKIYDEVYDVFDLVMFESRNPLKELSSEKKRFSIYRKECSYLDPQKFTASLHNEKKIQAVHLSLSHQLKIFLEIPGLFKEIVKYENKINKLFKEKKIFSSILHGSVWQNYYKPMYKDKTVIPVFLYFDDYGTGNALGTHAANQKIGAVYVSLPTLQPHLRAKLKNIFSTTIFRSENRELSHNEVFHKIITELNILSVNGLKDVNVDGELKLIYFQCVTILGDNLGLNQICGFEASFNATYYCRRCRLNSEVCRCLASESDSALRTIKNYEEDLAQLKNGIKAPCVFNDIHNFHIIRCPSLDLAHDMFEGLAKYTVECVLTHLILVQGKIRLDDVNKAITEFNYGSLESKNKPRPLEIEVCKEDFATGGKRKIKCNQSASEMACLSRYLGLMIGDKLELKNNDFWKIYRKLRKVIGAITMPTFVSADLDEIKKRI